MFLFRKSDDAKKESKGQKKKQNATKEKLQVATPPQEPGTTRELTKEFFASRAHYHEQAQNEANAVLSLLKIVAMSREPTKIEDQEVKECQSCKASFGRWKQKMQCPLCSPPRILCANCCSKEQTIHKSSIGDTKGMASQILVCDQCYNILQRKKIIETRREKVKNSGEREQLASWWNVSDDIKHSIMSALPQFRELVNSIAKAEQPTAEDIDRLGRLGKGLAGFFNNLDLAMQKLKAYQGATAKQRLLKENMQRAFLEFAQTTIPEFRILQQQMKVFMSPKFRSRLKAIRSAPASMESSTPMKTSEPDLEHHETQQLNFDVDSNSPFVELIETTLCPLQGADLLIRGRNFSAYSSVKIGSLIAESTCLDKSILYVIAPTFDRPGVRSLEIINPDNSTCSVHDLLYFTNEFISEDRSSTLPNDELSLNSLLFESKGKGLIGDESVPFDSIEAAISGVTPKGSAVGSKKSSSTKASGDARSTILSKNSDGSSINRTTTREGDGTTLRNAAPSRSHVIVHTNKAPTITSVHPTLSPMQGTEITITGKHFAQGIIAKIGSKTVDARSIHHGTSEDGECTLTFTSPLLPGGFQHIELINSNGKGVKFENIIFYTSDQALIDSIESTRKNAAAATKKDSLRKAEDHSVAVTKKDPIHSLVEEFEQFGDAALLTKTKPVSPATSSNQTSIAAPTTSSGSVLNRHVKRKFGRT